MKVTQEKTENKQVLLTIEMEPAEMEESLDKARRRLARKTSVPGFRKGKVPQDILERFLGPEKISQEALNDLIPEAYEKAVKEVELEPYAQPTIEITQREPVIFKATVSLPPEVQLGDYKTIRLTREPAVVADEDIETTLEQLRHQHATWEPVERPAMINDLAVLDVESDIEGEAFLNREGMQYQILEERPFPAPGFAEQLVGMKAGEEKSFALKFTAEQSTEKLAGKEPNFRVKVTEVKQEMLPELDDDFARGLNPEISDLADLRERLAEGLKARAEEKARVDYEEKAIDAMVDLSQAEFPPILLEVELDRMLSQQAQGLQMASVEEYLSRVNKTEEELRDGFKPQATKRVVRQLVLGRFAGEEKIEISHEEIDAEIENLTSGASRDKDKLKRYFASPQGHDSVARMLLSRKTMQRLLEIVEDTGEAEATIPAEEEK